MRKFRNIPALVTLLAGFVSSVVMIIQKYSLVHFLWVLVAVVAGVLYGRASFESNIKSGI